MRLHRLAVSFGATLIAITLAQPARGIDEIIRGWQLVDGQKSALFLRGPDNAWRQRAIRMAADLGLLERSIYFLDAVSEAELVAAA